MGVENRPYVGSWRLGQQELVQHTPDALVYINGDTSVPGCPKCNGRIDIQQFVTEVSVDAGCDPAAHSASFTLSIPTHHHDSFARDARFILRPGLEVHIYYRGYFPVKGLYENLSEPKFKGEFTTSGRDFKTTTGVDPRAADWKPQTERKRTEKSVKGIKKWSRGERGINHIVIHEPGLSNPDAVERVFKANGTGVHLAVAGADGNVEVRSYADPNTEIVAHTPTMNDESVGIEVVNGYYGTKAESGQAVINAAWAHKKGGADRTYAVPPQNQLEEVYRQTLRLSKETGVPMTFPSVEGDTYNFKPTKNTKGAQGKPGIVSHQQTGTGHADGSFIVLYMAIRQRNYSPEEAYREAVSSASFASNRSTTLPPAKADPFFFDPASKPTESTVAIEDRRDVTGLTTLRTAAGKPETELDREVREGVDDPVGWADDEVWEKDLDELAKEEKEGELADPELGPSLLNEAGLSGFDIEKLLAYPYYHCFRGVIIDVNVSWSAGVQTVTVQCASLLHFWQYHQISTNASYFGSRPLNSNLKTSLIGHNYTGMHPYEIIYTLHHDTAGAAGGVAWALSKKTNQRARSPISGESLFSLNVKYWERRFSTKEQKLRMHGATGDLFSSAQAAFLGSTGSQALTDLLRSRFGNPQKAKGRRRGILQQAIALGLFDQKRLEALQFIKRSRPGFGQNPTSFDLNMIEIEAFVRDLGNYGQLNLMESSYESKLDLAERVVQLTGFEFYQDVDGDLVFKPPMYNMDTSTSRVYRIEDIDLINVNFSEKEPQATYITCKGSQFKNLAGTGMENEWGVQGQYIDYRLVAQYGWRPADMETAYFNNSKAMFFAAVTRLDVLNAPSNSATVTIPLRPEMRPGYPVYIPYLDCYYYCNNFSHSYSVGGQCTTNLQLIGKRAKFYAPGRYGQDGESGGIEDIDLSNLILPERPLEVVDEAGRPRLSGFPNVVMALDPEQINPMFFVVGSDIDVISDSFTLDNLVQKAVELHILEPSNQEGVYLMSFGEDEDVRFWFRSPRDKAINPGQGSPTAPSGAIDLQAAAQEYIKRKKQAAKQWEGQQSEITGLNSKITQAQAKARNLSQSLDNPTLNENQQSSIKSQLRDARELVRNLQAKKEALEQRYEQQRFDFEQQLNTQEGTNISYLKRLIDELGESFIQSNKSDYSRYGDTSSTVNLLDMLSSKKAIFTNGSLPGTYRYYSASHPDKEQQGQLMPVFRVKGQQDQKSIEYENPFLEAVWQNQTVLGYVESDKITRVSGTTIRPEAQLKQIQPEWGIRILTNNPLAPRGEVVPTSEIRELSFAAHRTDLRRKLTNTKRRNRAQNLDGRLRSSLEQSAFVWTQRQQPSTSSTVSDILESWFTSLIPVVLRSVEISREQVPGQENQVPDFPSLTAPQEIVVSGSTVAVDIPIGETFRFSDTPQDRGQAYPGSGKQPLSAFWKKAARAYARSVFDSFHAARQQWYDEIQSNGFLIEDAQAVSSAFNESFGGAYKTKVRPKDRGKGRRKPSIQKDIVSPVFPVSDEKGYTLIGSYRYGRGVDIESNGVFDVLHNQDPLQLLDKHTIEQVLDVIIRRQSITVEEQTGTAKNGSPIITRRKVSGAEALSSVEEEVLRQLQGQLTSKQILDLGIAKRTSDPNLLQMDLINWFSEKGREGIQKVPVNNAAFSLADLRLHTQQNICSCKAAEATVLLDSAYQNGFVQFIEPGSSVPQGFGTGNEDRTTQWLVNESALVSASWQMSQKALRGQVLERRQGTLLKTAENLDFTEAMRDSRALRERAEQQAAQIGTQAQKIASDAEESALEFADEVKDFLE